MQKSKELLIVAGLPRSGTTWLEGILNAHPSVFLYHEIDDADSKEKAFSTINHKINAKTEQAYQLALMKGVEHLKHPSNYDPSNKRNADLVGFKTVGRFTHPTVFSWMRKTLDFPKTIFIIRHPCGYAASQLRFPSLKNVPASEIIRNEKWYIESLNGNVDSDISLAQFYALTWKLSNGLILNDNIDTNNFYYLIYEDLCKSPETETHKIFNFLELAMHKKVSTYLKKSTNPNENLLTKLWSKRFYSTTKNPLDSANKWKKELSEKQQSEIMAELNHSPLMKHWDKP
ncbi:MAG: sulfotransferase [Gammaproteobacteria bacterium]|nr:sulfotransferase [Gammaproteobacteria bacterium]